MTQQAVKCARCGRQRGPDELNWNVEYSRGVIAGYLCPEDQTAGENAEAAQREADGDTGGIRHAKPGDPGFAQALLAHDEATMNEAIRIENTCQAVWTDTLQAIAHGQQPGTLDANELTAEAMARLTEAGAHGMPAGLSDAIRETFITRINDLRPN